MHLLVDVVGLVVCTANPASGATPVVLPYRSSSHAPTVKAAAAPKLGLIARLWGRKANGPPKQLVAHKAEAAKPSPAKAVEAEPYAILPDGTHAAPSDYGGGYHGTSLISPEVALKTGLPSRGKNTDLRNHAERLGTDSAFRGTTAFPALPDGGGAVQWAGKGGWVYDIKKVPTWRVNDLLQGRVRRPGSFGGNIMSGELEGAILAEVKPWQIKRWGEVEQRRGGRLVVVTWHDNPHFGHPEHYEDQAR